MDNTKGINCKRELVPLRSVGDSASTELWNHTLVFGWVQ